ncbi:C1 family peptidase [Desulfobacter curvatus]|uniref:C1 family peptidase n=1 Tax=Desulfobacter curvatus TaxID=2290 RepID=UPI0003603569|nr:C1 family peptidase [Desulfobacter curvatus]
MKFYYNLFSCIALISLIIFASFNNAGSQEVVEYSFGYWGPAPDFEKNLLTSKEINPGMTKDLLPLRFDWRDKGYVTEVKNQRECGGCWAFTCVGAIESKIMMLDGPKMDLSEQQLISCDNQMGGCKGGYATALRYWHNKGPVTERCASYRNTKPTPCSQLKGCSELDYRTTGFYTFHGYTVEAVKTSLLTDGPAFLGFYIYEDFIPWWRNGKKGEVYKQRNGKNMGGHAVLLIGYDNDKQAWLCKNSWGKTGPNKDGTFWLSFNEHRNNVIIAGANCKLVKKNPLGLWEKIENLVNDASFKMSIRANKSSYRIGDTLTITCNVAQKGYLNIISLQQDDDRYTVLFPNQYHPENLVNAGKQIMIPDDSDDFDFEAQPPKGKSLFAVFLTNEPLNLYKKELEDTDTLFQTITPSELKALVVTGKQKNTYGAGMFITEVK